MRDEIYGVAHFAFSAVAARGKKEGNFFAVAMQFSSE
jgi:hypothetical protein